MRTTARLTVFLLFLALSGPIWAANFLKDGQPDLLAQLPPPPSADSREQAEDMARVLALQASRTPAQETFANADAEMSVFRFADVLGPDFTADRFPVAAAFFARIVSDGNEAYRPVKNHYARPRPFLASPLVKPCVDPATISRTGSYPSGHATVGMTMGIVLSEIVPERRGEIMERATAYGNNRVLAGVHYPSDVAAGRTAGRIIAESMMADPKFAVELDRARAEIRSGLKWLGSGTPDGHAGDER